MSKKYEQYEWMCEVAYAKREILLKVMEEEAAEILRKVFELCQGEFDINHMEEKYPEYYRILKEFCTKEMKTKEEIFTGSQELVKFFDKHSKEMQEFDVDLYYAVLNFISMLKNRGIYFDILYSD